MALAAPEGVFSGIAVGVDTACAIAASGIQCFGANRAIIDGAPASGQFSEVSVGSAHACALDQGGAPLCWGGEAGNGAPTDGAFVTIAASEYSTCAVRDDDKLVCWGESQGESATEYAHIETGVSDFWDSRWCGLRPSGEVVCDVLTTTADFSVAPPEGNFVQLAVSSQHACAVRSDSAVLCWGEPQGFTDHLQVPDGLTSRLTLPGARVTTGGSGSNAQTCTVLADGAFGCWGVRAGVEHWIGQPRAYLSSVGAASDWACGLTSEGAALCWQQDGTTSEIAPAGIFDQIYGGDTFICARGAGNDIACWGRGGADASPPNPTGIEQLDVSGGTGCGVRQGGALTCWGDNFYGQADAPAGTFVRVSVSRTRSCAVDANGGITCWGQGGCANVCDGAPAGPYLDFELGSEGACAILEDGTLSCWPTEAWSEAPAGKYKELEVAAEACAVRDDDRVICWGSGRPVPLGF